MPKTQKKTTARSKRPEPLSRKDTNAGAKPSAGRAKKSTGKSAETNSSIAAATPNTAAAANKYSKPYTSYLLLCSLLSTDNPNITRVLSVPGPTTFTQLHFILQEAFTWGHCHAYSFQVQEARPVDTDAYRFPNTLLDIGREFEMHWKKDIAADRYEVADESTTKLDDIYAPDSRYRGGLLKYEYDRGDGWAHRIACLGQADPALRVALGGIDQDAFCVAGEGHPCAEDCGGPPGWEDLKALFVKKGKKDPEGRKEWYKTCCMNGDRNGLDPFKWDILQVNDDLRSFKL